MSITKIAGAIVGIMFGAAISGLYLGAALDNTSAPATAVVATVLLSVLVGAALGAYVGSQDRRGGVAEYFPVGGSDDVEARLKRLETLRSRGLLTPDEYEKRRATTLEDL